MRDFNSIMSGFNKTLVKLEKLVTRNDVKAAANEDVIDRLKKENEALDEESFAASAAADRIRDLIGG